MSKIRKPATPVLFLVTLACLSAVLFASCDGPKTVSIPVPVDTSALAKINHFIPETQIREYQAAFKSDYDSLRQRFPSLVIPDAEAFNKPAVLEILKDPRCVGIRIYHGVKRDEKRGYKDEIRLIIVGVDSQGNEILFTPSGGAADLTQANGGLQHGQCPNCLPKN